MGTDFAGNVEWAKRALLLALRKGQAWSDCEQAAVRLTDALLKEGAKEAGTVRELRRIGISKKGAKQLVQIARTRLPAASSQARAGNGGAKPAEDHEDRAVWAPVCPHCLEPVSAHDHFCPKCAGPITAIASMDPMGQIYSATRAYHQAVTSKKPRFVAVLGMWLIFGPQVLFLAVSLFMTLSDVVAPGYIYRYGNGSFLVPENSDLGSDLFKLLFYGVILAVYIALLWRTTARYMRVRGSSAE